MLSNAYIKYFFYFLSNYYFNTLISLYLFNYKNLIIKLYLFTNNNSFQISLRKIRCYNTFYGGFGFLRRWLRRFMLKWTKSSQMMEFLLSLCINKIQHLSLKIINLYLWYIYAMYVFQVLSKKLFNIFFWLHIFLKYIYAMEFFQVLLNKLLSKI